jgi:hypothetical protein
MTVLCRQQAARTAEPDISIGSESISIHSYVNCEIEADLGGFSIAEDESPFFCLLEDDSLITSLSVTADRLLMPQTGSGHCIHDVFLVIRVRGPCPIRWQLLGALSPVVRSNRGPLGRTLGASIW